MKRSINSPYILFILLFFLSCSDNSSGPKNIIKTNIKGQVQAPDNATPIEGATIYVGTPLEKNSAGKGKVPIATNTLSKNNNCEEPPVDYTAFACTDADGNFEFQVEVDKTNLELKVFKGEFYFTKSINVDADGTTDVKTVTMSTDNINIAVITGAYDRMQDVLAKVGFGEIVTDQNAVDYGQLKLGTEAFDLYDGDSSLPENYPDMATLFEDSNGDGKLDINNYDIVFVNCGANEEYVFPTQGKSHSHAHTASAPTNLLAKNQVSAIRNYVQNGGMLYTTDLAYNYTEQVFPSYIDFLGDPETAADEAEQIYAAEEGKADITVSADILDSNLKNWLSVVDCESGSCLDNNQTVTIRGFASSWAVMNGPHQSSDAKLWVEGPVEWYDSAGERPLTASFTAGSGKVIYSSYHTIENDHSPKFHPQERILQYLVFE